jgi:hypothetical protein
MKPQQTKQQTFNSPPVGSLSVEVLDKENAMSRFNDATLGADLLMDRGPSIYEQLEMQKKTNASPDGKPLGAGKRMEMFSKSKNTWEKFTVVDFEGSKGLYKCEFGGGRSQWLNLRQKELRDL